MSFYICGISRKNNRVRKYIGAFPDEHMVDRWYDSVLKLRKDNLSKEKLNIEKYHQNGIPLKL